ncbi:MAG: ROK family protein [bacterium]|nr:ROK family protein [bacterium]
MILLFDLGGTKLRMALSRDGKRFFAVRIIASPKTVNGGLKAFQSYLEDNKIKKLKAVVGSIASSFDRRKSVIVGGGANIKGWLGKPLKQILGRGLKAPVFLENDAALAGLGEAMRGAGKGKEIVAYVTVSTGFGGARITRGRIDDSAYGFEPSYQIAMGGKKYCSRCRDMYLGHHIDGASLRRHYHKDPKDIKNPKIQNDLAYWLAIALHNAIVFWSPDVIVLGGSVMNIIPLERVRTHLKKFYRHSLPPIRRAKLGDLGGLWGALAYLKQSK